MKKYIAAFDGLNFCKTTMRYAIHLARQSNAHLVGVFLEDFTRRSYGALEIAKYAGAEVDKQIQELDDKDQDTRWQSVRQFEEACESVNIPYAVHRDRNVALQELLQESIYADLLIISGSTTMTRFHEPAPTRFIRELLNDVQCPVVLVPETYRIINKIILLYDGEPSSVRAARTFSYLFSPLKSLPTEVLSVEKMDEPMFLSNSRLIKEFISQHYPDAETVLLKGDPETEIASYLVRETKNPIVISGAYQRSKFSRLFKPSMADFLIQELDVPLFIAHNKS